MLKTYVITTTTMSASIEAAFYQAIGQAKTIMDNIEESCNYECDATLKSIKHVSVTYFPETYRENPHYEFTFEAEIET